MSQRTWLVFDNMFQMQVDTIVFIVETSEFKKRLSVIQSSKSISTAICLSVRESSSSNKAHELLQTLCETE